MKTCNVWRPAGLAMAALLTMAGCAAPNPGQPPGTSGSPSSMPSTRFHVQALTKDGEPVERGEWTEISLPDAPTGGLIILHSVCNNPQFEVRSVDGKVWTTVKTGIESAEGCGQEDHAIKTGAVAALEGQLTVDETGGRVELTNPPYELVLERDH